MAATDETLRTPGRARADEHTEPVDYAAINAVYAALAAGLLYATRERAADDPIPVRELVPLSAATFALSKVIAREKGGTWLREPFVPHAGVPGGEKFGPGRRAPFAAQDGPPPRPTGRRLRRAVGELVTCTRCV